MTASHTPRFRNYILRVQVLDDESGDQVERVLADYATRRNGTLSRTVLEDHGSHAIQVSRKTIIRKGRLA